MEPERVTPFAATFIFVGNIGLCDSNPIDYPDEVGQLVVIINSHATCVINTSVDVTITTEGVPTTTRRYDAVGPKQTIKIDCSNHPLSFATTSAQLVTAIWADANCPKKAKEDHSAPPLHPHEDEGYK